MDEGHLIEDDLELKRNFSLRNCAKHSVTMTSLAFEQLAKTNPGTAFLHCSPGGVETNAARNLGGVTGKLLQIATPLLRPWMVPLEESGERQLYTVTAPAFAAKNVADQKANVGIDGMKGSGAYLVGSDNGPTGKLKLMKDLREKRTGEKVWEHTLEVFRRVE